MSIMQHESAKASHYNKSAAHYDEFNEKKSLALNAFIAEILKQHKAHCVLDLACGTGSQVFYLSNQGFDVVGVDINAKMLQVAKSKAQQENLDLKFIKGDMRTTQVGKFDAVVTMFNAIGHLTKADFQQAIDNIYGNLKKRGLYIFDIFNLEYLLHDDNITALTIDWQEKTRQGSIRKIQYSTINEEGILASYTIRHESIDKKPPKINKGVQTLQVYTVSMLKMMLEKNGFKIVRQCSIDGARLGQRKTQRLFIVARAC